MDTLRIVLIIIGVLIVVGIYLFSRRKSASKRLDDAGDFIPDYPPEPLTSPGVGGRQVQPDDLAEQLDELSGVITQYRRNEHGEPVTGLPASERRSVAQPAPQMHAPAQERPVHPLRPPRNPEKPPVSEPDTDIAASVSDVIPEIIILNIVARPSRAFKGAQLLSALDMVGLQFGGMGIFHRSAPGDGKRPLYSLANMLKPGSFDMEDMTVFETQGLTLFMQLPAPVDSLSAYEDMLATAQGLAAELQGELCDERRNTLTTQGIEHTRGQIRAFSHKLLLARRRAEQQR